MPASIPVMPVVFALLLLLPVRLSPRQLKGLAFFLWLTGGLILAARGVVWLVGAHPAMGLLAGCLAGALAVGFGKGRFVLSKTSRRNIERLEALREPQPPIRVYSGRSWAIIAVMVAISVGLNLAPVDPLWRGTINLAIGMALIISSMAYLRAPGPGLPATEA